MVRVDKPYTFEGPDGTVGLLDLFDGRPQLVMHHFMFGPDWDQGCPSCSSAADRIGRLRQLHVRNTTLVAVSRAPYAKLAAFRERMGWTFPWYSSYGSDFNYDFHATLDDRVAPVLLHFRTEAELAEAGTPWTGGPWTEDMRGEEMPGISAFLRVDDEVFHTYSTFGRGIEEFHNGYPLPRPHRPRPPGGVGGTEGPRDPARPAGRRPGDAPARRVRRMSSWADIEQAEPEFARRVQGLFDAHRHKTIATVRADGGPRISGIEASFADGELTFGSMPGARKGADLRRDPRFALHGATVDPQEGREAEWPGEAKIAGVAIAAGAISDGPDGDLFRADITEVVHTHLNEAATLLVVEWWTPSGGLKQVERE